MCFGGISLVGRLVCCGFFLANSVLENMDYPEKKGKIQIKNVFCWFYNPGVIEFKVLRMIQEKHNGVRLNYRGYMY